jgi:F-type H+-transporting ATPase subunit a
MESTERTTSTSETQDTSTPEVQAASESTAPETITAETQNNPLPEVQAVPAEAPRMPETATGTTAVDMVDTLASPAPTPSPSPFAPVAPTPSEPNFFQKQPERIQAWIQADPARAWTTLGIVVLLLLSILIKYVVEVPQPHVSLAGQPLMQNGPSWFTNSLLTTFVVDIILIVLAALTTRRMELIPQGLQNFMEMVLEFLYGLAESIAGKAAAIYFPWAATLFLFIIISNYTGLIPFVGSLGFYHTPEPTVEHARLAEGQLAMANGKLLLQEGGAAEEAEHGEELVPLFRAPSADLSTTFALSLATMFMVQYYGFRALGGKYFRKFAFWNPTGHGYMKAINGFVMFLELISELSRILTFAFRLFGNIFAGEVVLAVISFLVAFLIPLPFYGLEVMVGAIQALVFTMLALIFFSMATISHEPGGEHH